MGRCLNRRKLARETQQRLVGESVGDAVGVAELRLSAPDRANDLEELLIRCTGW
jgi:hypothetical protein